MTGMIRLRSEFSGRKPSATKSVISASQSLLPRWIVALIMASRSSSGTCLGIQALIAWRAPLLLVIHLLLISAFALQHSMHHCG